MSKQIECPSGLIGVIRGLKGKEAKFLSDRQAIKSGQFIDQILSACWEQTDNPGPYTLRPDGTLDWAKALVGDRFFALVQLRIQTFGADYEFKVQCGNSACRESFVWRLDLENDLPVKKLSDEDRLSFQNGNTLRGTIPYGQETKDFTFKLNTGVDEARIAKFRAQKPALTALVLTRIHQIEGVEEKQRRNFIEDAEFKVLTDIITEMDKHDCGLETSFEVECTACYARTDVQLPFERNFLFPQEKGV